MSSSLAIRWELRREDKEEIKKHDNERFSFKKKKISSFAINFNQFPSTVVYTHIHERYWFVLFPQNLVSIKRYDILSEMVCVFINIIIKKRM